MQCIECKGAMELIDRSDDPDQGIAYNVYHCVSCMLLAKENLWENSGVAWLDKNNKLTIVSETGETPDNKPTLNES